MADTDIAALQAVRFSVESEDGTRSESSTVQRTDVPAYVSVVRDEGTYGPLVVTAMGLVNGEGAIVRRQRVSFVKHQTRVVKMHLAASCVRKTCGAEETCSETGCVPVDVPENELGNWGDAVPRIDDPPPPPPDSGMREMDGGDGGADAGVDARVDGAAPEAGPRDAGPVDAGPVDAGPPPDSGLTACDGGWFDLNNDPYRCGKGCTEAKTCEDGTLANTIRTCKDGSCCAVLCTLGGGYTCKRGYGNCVPDGLILPDGCETNLNTSVAHCGRCDNPCASNQACTNGVCQPK